MNDDQIQFLVLSLPTKLIAVRPLPSGNDLIQAINERQVLLDKIAALERGEFICRRCGLRKDSEFQLPEGESPF